MFLTRYFGNVDKPLDCDIASHSISERNIKIRKCLLNFNYALENNYERVCKY